MLTKIEKAKYVKALRAGTYMQGTFFFRDTSPLTGTRFCVVGVLPMTQDDVPPGVPYYEYLEKVRQWTKKAGIRLDPMGVTDLELCAHPGLNQAMLAKKYSHWLKKGYNLGGMNDSGFRFDQFADFMGDCLLTCD